MENFMTDRQAVCRLKNGDIGGLEFLIRQYQEKALHAAFLITHNQQMAEDVVQDTFVRIYQRVQSFDVNRPFEPYLLRSVINAAINAIEKSSNWVQLDEQVDVDSVNHLITHATKTEDIVEFNQRKKEIFSAISKLSPRQRAVIVQRYYLEMSEKEMAEVLSAAPGTVKWLLNDARQRLRVLLGSERSAK
jgi:RNA polymerase sigma-70 factor (ECF subfamily)